MTSRALAVLLAPLLLLAPGCGTLITRKHGQDTEAFAGCKADLFVISAPFVLAAGDPSCLTGVPFCLTAGLIDLPLSFVGDLCVLIGRAGDRDEPTPAASSGTPAEDAPASACGEVAVAQAEPPGLTLGAVACDPR